MFIHKIGIAVGILIAFFGLNGLAKIAEQKAIDEKAQAQQRIDAVNRAAAAENSKKAADAQRALSSPLPGKIFDLDNKNKR